MTTTRAGEVWLTEVDFPDGRGSRLRPTLVLFSDNQDSVLSVVTSASPRTARDLPLQDWASAGLHCPSTVRLDKLVTMSQHRLWAKLGSLSKEDWQHVVALWNVQMRLPLT